MFQVIIEGEDGSVFCAYESACEVLAGEYLEHVVPCKYPEALGAWLEQPIVQGMEFWQGTR